MSSSNIQKLGDTLTGRMQKTARAAVPMTLEMGTINENLSLSTDSLRDQIPRGDYMVALHLAAGSYRTSTETHTHSGSNHSHNDGAHSHDLPGAFRGIQPGDRVLVAWCGNDPVIISIIVSS